MPNSVGRVAFSRVYFAAEVSLGNRLVVVKVTTMGRHEAHTLGQLQHSQVVPIFSVRSDGPSGLTAVCLPYCGRTTFFDVADAAFGRGKPPRDAGVILESARRGNLGTQAVGIPVHPAGWRRSWNYVEGIVHLGSQVAEALAFTHSKGFLHCDIKPSNVLVTESGQALLFDFNLSFLGHGDEPTAGGTIPYMAPEQLERVAGGDRGQSTKLDARTDVFGLAVTLFEMPTGRLPFGCVPTHLTRTQTAAHFLAKQKKGPARLRDLNPHVDCRIARIIETCLAFRPEDRLQTASEMVDAFRAEMAWRPHAIRWLRDHRRLTAAAVVATSLSTSGVVFGLATREPYPLRELQAGWLAHERGNLADAIVHLDRAVEADAKLLEARFLRGLFRMERMEWELALGDFRALEHRLDDPRVYACIGHLEAVYHDQYSVAAIDFRHAIDRGFQTPELLNNLGHCYDRLGDLENAEGCLEEALSRDSTLQVAAHNLALTRLHLAIQKHEGVDVGIVERALRMGPESLQLCLDAARVFAMSAQLGESDQTQAEKVSRCVDLCVRSVQLGATHGQVRVVGSGCELLRNDARFQDLLQRAADQKSLRVPAISYMVNPLGRTIENSRVSLARR